MIAYTGQIDVVRERISEARELLHISLGMSASSWLDISIHGIWQLENCGDTVPCKSLWDGRGMRLAASLVFENTISGSPPLSI